MNNEKLNNFLRDKKEAVEVGIKNLKARFDLMNLVSRGCDDVMVIVRRDGENVFCNERLNLRGYHPEDTIYHNVKNVGGPATVDILVIKEREVFGMVSIRNRK